MNREEANRSFGALRHQHSWRPVDSADIPLNAVHRAAALHVKTAKTVLDVGCGNGYFTAALQGWGKQAEGCDVSNKAIAFCKRHFKGAAKRLFFQHDVTQPLRTKKQYEAVVCLDVLDGIEDLKGAFDVLWGCVAPEGQLLISVPQSMDLAAFFSAYDLTPEEVTASAEGFILYRFLKKADPSAFRYALINPHGMAADQGRQWLQHDVLNAGIPNWARMLGGTILSPDEAMAKAEGYDLYHIHLAGVSFSTPLRFMEAFSAMERRPLLMISIDYSPELWNLFPAFIDGLRLTLNMADLVVNQHPVITDYWAPQLQTACYDIPHPFQVDRLKALALSDSLAQQGLATIIHTKYDDKTQALPAFMKHDLPVGRTAIFGGTLSASKEVTSVTWAEIYFDQIHSYAEAEEHLERLAGYRYGLDLHPHHTIGRQGVEMACLGIPTVAYDSNESYKRCFPALTIPYGDVAAGRAKLHQLVSDDNLWTAARAHALEAVDYYSYDNVKRLLKEAIDDARPRLCDEDTSVRPAVERALESLEGEVGDHPPHADARPGEPHGRLHHDGAERGPELSGVGSADAGPPDPVGYTD